ncbi:MAG: ChaN family lipoprotein [Bacteroidota bacterium]|nr:ChaN family lipoprotein [Bacteroidota bacterium]
MKYHLLLSLSLHCLLVFSQKPAYKIFDKSGAVSSYDNFLESAKKADLILFGEFHDNPIHHWLQLELVNELHQSGVSLILGAEMFESDNQLIIDEYLAGYYNSDKLTSESKTWINFETDYLPLLEFSKTNGIDFIATNVPRRYASMVYKYGLDILSDLSDEAKSLMAPLPIKIDTSWQSYKEINTMAIGHGGANLASSQFFKDATMAHFISNNLKKNYTFIHFHGAFHSQNYEGIYSYVKSKRPRLNILSICCHEQEQLLELKEGYKKSDYIILTPVRMTKTH